MFGWQPLQPEEPSFSDLGGWYDGYVEAALAHGAFDSADVFRPRDAITRREMAVMLVRALGFGPLAAQVQTASLPFTDVSADRGYITIAHDIGMSSRSSSISSMASSMVSSSSLMASFSLSRSAMDSAISSRVSTTAESSLPSLVLVSSFMPSFSPEGRAPPREEVDALLGRCRPSVFFSPELGCKYFTCRENGRAQFVLFDDADTAAYKLGLARQRNLPAVFLLWSEWGPLAKEIAK